MCSIITLCYQDLLNFDDPLNLEAAEHYQRDKVNAQHDDYTATEIVVIHSAMEIVDFDL